MRSLSPSFLFLFLWSIRKHKFQAGWLFSLYLLLAGVERFLIEKIRVNVRYDLGFLEATQAELVSVVLILGGLVGVVKFMGQKEFLPETITPVEKKPRNKKNTNKKSKRRKKK